MIMIYIALFLLPLSHQICRTKRRKLFSLLHRGKIKQIRGRQNQSLGTLPTKTNSSPLKRDNLSKSGINDVIPEN